MQQELFNRYGEPFQIHKFEKPRESLQYLDRKRLAGNCKILYEVLMRGERLSCTEMLLKYGVGDGRRRIGNLKENGVQVSFNKSATGHYKIWYMDDEQKKFNRKFCVLK